MQYSNIGDNELLYLIRCDNEDAKKCLFKRYQKRIYGIIDGFAKKYLIKGMDYEDYFQDCFIVFLKCIENYDEDYNFFNYVRNSIERELYKLIQGEFSKREIISLDNEGFSVDKMTMDVVSDVALIYDEYELKEKIDKSIDDKGRLILEYRLRGYSCIEISRMLNITKKSVYKKMDKIKNILKEKMSDKK